MKYFFTPLALAASLLANAQTLQQQAAAAAQPDAAAPPVRYVPMAPAGASGLMVEREDWKAANATVGQYRRGHMDIVRWEKAQARNPVPATPTQEPSR